MKKKQSSLGILLATGLAALASPIPASAGRDSAPIVPREDLMSIGVYYYPEHWPEKDWPRDFANIAAIGFEFVHMAEFAWADLEPREGVFDFAWLDRAVALAAKHRLKVILGTPTAAPPAWLAEKHPEIFIQDGRFVRQEHGIRGVCSTSSPVFRRYAEKIAEEMGKHYGQDARVWGWQLDNEPWAPPDYGPAAQSSFRDWLRRKFGTIEALNAAWGAAFWSLRYDSLDQVRIPNADLSGEDGLNPHALLDRARWNADEQAGLLDAQARTLRRRIAPGQWITTNYVSAVDGADPRRTRDLDFPSFTMYLVRGTDGLGPEGFRLGAPYRLSWAMDFFRPMAGTTGVMELQPGQVNWARVNPQPLPGAVRMWLWHAFSGGLSFACTYRYRHIPYGSEQYHDGIVGLDGTTLSPGGRQFRQVIGEMKEIRARYDPARIVPARYRARRAALLWNQENLWNLESQKQTILWNTRGHVEKSFAALKSCGAPVDIIEEDARFEDYAVLVAPAYPLVEAALAAKWRAFAENGGHLVLTCRTAQKDRAGWMGQGPFSTPLVPLMGAEIAFYDMLLESGEGRVAMPGEPSSFSWRTWADILDPAPGTETWASYADQFYKNRAAVVSRRLGKGSITYIGTESLDGRLEKAVVRRVYERAGIGVENYPEGVFVEWRDGFWVAVNYSSSAFELTLPAGAEILLGGRKLDPAGVCLWVEKVRAAGLRACPRPEVSDIMAGNGLRPEFH